MPFKASGSSEGIWELRKEGLATGLRVNIVWGLNN